MGCNPVLGLSLGYHMMPPLLRPGDKSRSFFVRKNSRVYIGAICYVLLFSTIFYGFCGISPPYSLPNLPAKQGVYEYCSCSRQIWKSITKRTMVTKVMLIYHVKKQITFWDTTSHMIWSWPESTSYTLTTSSYLRFSGKMSVSRLGISKSLSLLNITFSFCGKRAT